MKEIGVILAVDGKNAQVMIKRHAACGDCGACQIGKEKMTMETTARNDAKARIGDTVAVEMQTVNVIRATTIMYGIPLIAFLMGCGLGHVLASSLGLDAVLVPFFSGIILTVLTYLFIKLLDKKGGFGGQYQPIITKVEAAGNAEDIK